MAISCISQYNGCDGHPHGSRWETPCAGGTYTSQCFDGEAGIIATNCGTTGGEVKNIAGSVDGGWGGNIALAIKQGPICSAPAPARSGAIASVSDDDAYDLYRKLDNCYRNNLWTPNKVGPCRNNVLKTYSAQQQSEFLIYFEADEWLQWFGIQKSYGCHLAGTYFAARKSYATLICQVAGYDGLKSWAGRSFAHPGDDVLVYPITPGDADENINFGIWGANYNNYYFQSLVCIKTTPLTLQAGAK